MQKQWQRWASGLGQLEEKVVEAQTRKNKMA